MDGRHSGRPLLATTTMDRSHRRSPLFTALAALVVLAAVPGASPPAGAVVDPSLVDQWGLTKIGAPTAWATATGKGVTIAVIDTGVDLQHEDLGGKVSAHVSCIGADDDPSKCSGSGQDDHGHGSHVAGIAAAATGNGLGVASVAPEARILSVKVLEPDGEGGASGDAADVRAGVRWAVDHGADVINLSLGQEVTIFSIFGTSLDDAINDAWEAGVIPVVAAGNDSLFPSGYHNVDALVVTATDVNDAQASYASNVTGAQWGMAAPGGDGSDQKNWILSSWWKAGSANSYGFARGTSMAAPHVAGAAAVLLSLDLSPTETVDRILKTAADLGVPGNDVEFGWGRLDVAAAVAGLGQPSAPEPASEDPPTPAEPPPGPAPAVVVQGATASAVPTLAPPTTARPARPPAHVPAPPVAVPEPPPPPPEDAIGRVSRSGPGRTGAGPLQVVGAVMLALAIAGHVVLRRAGRSVAHISRSVGPLRPG